MRVRHLVDFTLAAATGNTSAGMDRGADVDTSIARCC